MFKLSGKPVNYLLRICGRVYTAGLIKKLAPQNNLDKSLVFQNIATFSPQAYPQLRSLTSPLFEQVFYPVYTGPITTTKI